MNTKLISVGDKYVTTNPGNAFGGERIVVSKVENANSEDGFVYFRTEKLIHRRKNQCVRVWWILEMCSKLEQCGHYHTADEICPDNIPF